MGRSHTRLGRKAFTLIELLVVISIIALLIGILLPALGSARFTARSAISLSNLRQIGIAAAGYQTDNKQHYPKHSSHTTTQTPSAGFFNISGAQELANAGQIEQSAVASWESNGAKPRWADFMFSYISEPKAFVSPNMTTRELELFTAPFATTLDQATGAVVDTTEFYGGYGLNFNYIGNGRTRPASIPEYLQPFHARDGVDIYSPANTILAGDIAGSRNGNPANEPGTGGAAVYSLDAPLGSVNRGSKGSRRQNYGGTENFYYMQGPLELPTATPETFLTRSAPAQRNSGGKAGFAFLDGSSRAMTIAEADDFDGDGTIDNGYWNGLANPSPSAN
jgi:prepilin-type N-terminal cleavage/methylation domain-containing protein